MSETITYTVPAIHCDHCAASIKEEVGEVEDVESVEELRSRYARLRDRPRGIRPPQARPRVAPGPQ